MSALPVTTPAAPLILGPYLHHAGMHHQEMPKVYRDTQAHAWHGATDWESKVHVLQCWVPIGDGAVLIVSHAPSKPDLFVVDAGWTVDERYPHQRNRYWRTDWGTKVEHVDPFVKVEVLGTAYQKEIEIPNPNWGSNGTQRKVKVIDSYGTYHRSGDAPGIPYNYLKVRVSMLDGSSPTEMELRFERPTTGLVAVNSSSRLSLNVSATFFGKLIMWQEDVSKYPEFHAVLKNYPIKEGRDALWSHWLQHRGFSWNTRDTASVKALENRKDIKPNIDRLVKEEPFLARYFAFLHSGKTSDKTSNNKLIAAFLERVGTDYDKLKAGLRASIDNVPNTAPIYEWDHRPEPIARNICLALEGAEDKVAEGKAKAQWQYAKGAKAKAEVLGISADRHPTLMARLEAGDISFNLFHEAGDEDKLVNVEFDLFERALARAGWGDTLVEVCQSASGRTTYSKRVTSYFAFLFKIEKYLDKHAPRPKNGKKAGGWKAIPKFVQSQSELEMTEATEEGTTKRRSAFTPVADNEAGTITVPYIAMSISGVRTTWCYSERYFVVEEGLEDPIFEAGGVYDSDLAEKLNGRDDYGLCSFTLTGTDRNTGYPTFLIIFERTTKHGTRVHFHRVHPSRKRGPNGSETPPNRLIEECYRYMAGNVRAEEILHQQGDLLLVKADGPGKSVDDPAGIPVYGFENHSFTANEVDGRREVVRLVRSKAKGRDNLLGWLHAETGMRMPHPEHEPIENIAPGWYELRRCKSWEANPTSVWVLNID